jgi:hypothetical protein
VHGEGIGIKAGVRLIVNPACTNTDAARGEDIRCNTQEIVLESPWQGFKVQLEWLLGNEQVGIGLS